MLVAIPSVIGLILLPSTLRHLGKNLLSMERRGVEQSSRTELFLALEQLVKRRLSLPVRPELHL